MTSWKQFSVQTKGRIQIGNTDYKIQQCITGEVSGPLVVSWGNSCAIFELISALAKQQSFKGGNLKKEDKGHFVVRGHATHDCKKSPPRTQTDKQLAISQENTTGQYTYTQLYIRSKRTVCSLSLHLFTLSSEDSKLGACSASRLHSCAYMELYFGSSRAFSNI